MPYSVSQKCVGGPILGPESGTYGIIGPRKSGLTELMKAHPVHLFIHKLYYRQSLLLVNEKRRNYAITFIQCPLKMNSTVDLHHGSKVTSGESVDEATMIFDFYGVS